MKSVFYKHDGTPVVASLKLKHLQAGAGQWQTLELSYTAPDRGYVQVFVANESDQTVYFDDLEVEHTPQLIVQENHYYPFGMNLAGIEKRGMPEHRFQYNGKEKQGEFGLNWMDYGARNYEASIGRWHSVDPLAEKNNTTSPYGYVLNNPVKFIDPDGMDNIIHLIHTGGLKNRELRSIVNNANLYFKELGLNTRVALFDGQSSDFDYDKIDKTDGIAVIGTDREKVADFIAEKVFVKFNIGGVRQALINGKIDFQNKLPSLIRKGNINEASLGSLYKLYDNLGGGSGNPEQSSLGIEGTSLNSGKNWVAVDYSEVKTTNSESFFGRNRGDEDLARYAIVHGAGHNAGVYENYVNNTNIGGIMTSGKEISGKGGLWGLIRSNQVSSQDWGFKKGVRVYQDILANLQYKMKMIQKFGDKIATNNYGKK